MEIGMPRAKSAKSDTQKRGSGPSHIRMWHTSVLPKRAVTVVGGSTIGRHTPFQCPGPPHLCLRDGGTPNFACNHPRNPNESAI